VAMRFPPFWAERTAVWFAQAEAQYTLVDINSESIKFCHVISQLDHRYATAVENIITSPPERDPYTTLRTELVRRLAPSREQRIRQSLTLQEMGDRKPRSLDPDVPDDFLRSIWSSRLSLNIQAFLAGQHVGSLDAAARCAYRISEVAPQPALASVGRPPNNTTLLQGMEGLSRQVAALSAEQERLRASFRDLRLSSRDPSSSSRDPRPGSRNRRPSSRSPPPQRGHRTLTLRGILPLRRLGATVYSALRLPPAGKLTQQTSPAAHVCSTTTGRLFITDRSTKR
jgi:hypothetical protein